MKSRSLRKNTFAQPGQECILPARHSRILRQVRVAIDRAGKDGDVARIDPLELPAARRAPQFFVFTDGDATVLDDDGAIAASPQNAEIWGIDNVSPEAKERFHGAGSARTQPTKRELTIFELAAPALEKKKIRAAHVGETTNTKNVPPPESP
ncbi:MAG: hypothetical protein M3Y86_06090 [Verrucomicrobiota bacterium]|nr:hypothetical protein [Verrucomicrobiota bacterium]